MSFDIISGYANYYGQTDECAIFKKIFWKQKNFLKIAYVQRGVLIDVLKKNKKRHAYLSTIFLLYY